MNVKRVPPTVSARWNQFTDEQLLDQIQFATFQYFWDGAHPVSGLAREGINTGHGPDIVTMGKPMGAGHPLAAVVTTPEIAAAFARETDYFNTFGGSPVSAAAGQAVLDVVEREHLLANVRRSGEHLINGLRELAARHALIGDVRGKDLFIAVELVRDRKTKEPARSAAAAVVEHLREHGVLTALIGRDRNALKFRPPLVFEKEHADIALVALDNALSAVA